MKQYKYTINGAQYDVTIDSIVGSKAKVEVNGIPFEVEMHGSSLVEEDLPTGQAVKKGDAVLVLEAMKMENNITAEADGAVTGICVAAGDSVMEGTTLLTIG